MSARSPMTTKLVGGLVLVVLAAAGWLFVLSPKTTALAEVRAQIQNTRDQNDTLRLQLVSLQRQQKTLRKTKATADALAAKFPPTADQPGLFEAVTAAAEKAAIPASDVTALTPTPPVIGGVDAAGGVALPGQSTGSDLARQSVTLSVEADYEQTQLLLADLEDMARAYLVTSLTLTSGETDSFVTTITGDMFVMPPAAMRREAIQVSRAAKK